MRVKQNILLKIFWMLKILAGRSHHLQNVRYRNSLRIKVETISCDKFINSCTVDAMSSASIYHIFSTKVTKSLARKLIGCSQWYDLFLRKNCIRWIKNCWVREPRKWVGWSLKFVIRWKEKYKSTKGYWIRFIVLSSRLFIRAQALTEKLLWQFDVNVLK